MTPTLLLLGITVLGFTGLLLIIQPVWAAIDIVKSQDSSASKATWLLLVLLAWSIVSVFYGIFCGKTLKFKIASVLSLLTAIAWISLFVHTVNHITQYTRQYVGASITVYQKTARKDLTAQQKKNMEASLKQMTQQAHSSWWSLLKITNYKKPQQDIALYQHLNQQATLLSFYCADGHFSNTEYKQWMHFHQLKRHDWPSLKLYLINKKGDYDLTLPGIV